MRLLVNHQLMPIAILPKNIPFEQICYKGCQGFPVTSLHCLLFLKSKNKDLKRISKSAANVGLSVSLFFHSNVLKLTIELHSIRLIISLKFLHRDDY